jgi:hypothetical protein
MLNVHVGAAELACNEQYLASFHHNPLPTETYSEFYQGSPQDLLGMLVGVNYENKILPCVVTQKVTQKASKYGLLFPSASLWDGQFYLDGVTLPHAILLKHVHLLHFPKAGSGNHSDEDDMTQ